MEPKRPNFFCHSIGSTLSALSYLPHNKARALLHRLNHKTDAFYYKQENNIFMSCLPTVFCSTMQHFKTLTLQGKEDSKEDLEDNFKIIRVLHLRDTLFLVVRANNVIEIHDLSLDVAIVVDSIALDLSNGAL